MLRGIAPGARVVTPFTQSGTYTKSSSARFIGVLAIGGGGGGGFGGTYTPGSGSGGGGGGGGAGSTLGGAGGAGAPGICMIVEW